MKNKHHFQKFCQIKLAKFIFSLCPLRNKTTAVVIDSEGVGWSELLGAPYLCPEAAASHLLPAGVISHTPRGESDASKPSFTIAFRVH